MQNVLTKSTISASAAKRIVEAAEREAHAMAVPMVIAVTDDVGHLKTFLRMDGAPVLSVELAIDKAYTSAAYGIPTHAWHDFIKDDPPLLHGIVKTKRLIVFGGGFPIKVGAAVVGAIGVSGGHYSQDMKVAEAALKQWGEM